MGSLDIFLQELSCIRVWVSADILGGAFGDDLTARLAAFGTQIDDVVGDFDDIQVVFDDQDSVAAVHQAVQHFDQLVHIRSM